MGQCLMTSGVDDKLLYKAGTPKMCEVSRYTVDTSIPASGCASSLATLNPKSQAHACAASPGRLHTWRFRVSGGSL